MIVAVKVIDTGTIREDYVFKNLTREARLLSKLRHPNIVRLYETIQCGSVYYLVLELATGGDLSSHIKNQPLCRLDEKMAKGYGRQLVSALEHMHSRGIVHRDLKMENIMLQDPWKERIKIVDFGLSNMYTGESLLKTHCGSPEYAAPELFVVGKRYGPEVDLWSLGVVFYAMATGRLPFQSPRDGQTSSEEHRRKLLAQINRGLTQAQKKTIASMSGEYRNLVNRLLMPAAHKRITIQELCFHPWIANRLKNIAVKASQADLIALEHNTIVDEIAEATNRDRTLIERDILQSKYGEIGGMYNIKAHVMRQVGSFHAFKARSWITTLQPARYTNAQNNHTAENSSSEARNGFRKITAFEAGGILERRVQRWRHVDPEKCWNNFFRHMSNSWKSICDN
ncbi:SNF1-related protein kinase catalytic subunit alpha KIN12-like [Diprion similis]|uniref:SNF1-related protein kinase catalytic subunit alpha KIN12-like n=1 Tax=Diprion similis TaxID=362088 RepID=UPI001EF8B042|nr:SNF1-related protein kinase catalytic subunit alpha KIN12-like [Diprion similis]